MTAVDNLAGVTVSIGFGVNAIGGDYFVLDDPVKGELDGTTYLLAPDTVFVDVTDHVAAIATTRGRERELDEYATGTATVVFNDDDRTFDPSYTGSPYAGEIVPMKRIAIRWGTTPLFTGWVEDWTVVYEPGDNLSRVTAECVDGFAILASQEIDEIVAAHSGEDTGQRITRVLNRTEIDFPASRSIGAGQSTLGATTFGENALSYLQRCNRAEAGYLFVASNGTLIFRNRTSILNVPADITFSDDRTVGIPYLTITQRSTVDLLYTRITGESETTGNPLESVDTDAIADFLIRTLSLGTLMTLDDDQTQNLIDYYRSRFSTVEARFQAATVNVAALDTGQVRQLVSLELIDVVNVERAPLGIDSIERFSIIDGIAHSIGHGSWTTTLAFANADSRSFLALDDTMFGTLGSNRVAF